MWCLQPTCTICSWFLWWGFHGFGSFYLMCCGEKPNAVQCGRHYMLCNFDSMLSSLYDYIMHSWPLLLPSKWFFISFVLFFYSHACIVEFSILQWGDRDWQATFSGFCSTLSLSLSVKTVLACFSSTKKNWRILPFRRRSGLHLFLLFKATG